MIVCKYHYSSSEEELVLIEEVEEAILAFFKLKLETQNLVLFEEL